MPYAERRKREKERDARKAGLVAPPLPNVMSMDVQPYREVLSHRRQGEDFTYAEEQAILAVLAMYDGNAWRAWRALEPLVSQTGISHVLDRNEGTFERVRAQWKQATTRHLQRVAHRMGEKLAEAIEVQTPSVRDLSIALGVVIDKTAVLAGDGVTVRHVHALDEGQLNEVTKRLSAYSQAPSEPQAEVIEGEWELKSVE